MARADHNAWKASESKDSGISNHNAKEKKKCIEHGIQNKGQPDKGKLTGGKRIAYGEEATFEVSSAGDGYPYAATSPGADQTVVLHWSSGLTQCVITLRLR